MLLAEDPWDDLDEVEPDFFVCDAERSARPYDDGHCREGRRLDDVDEIPPDERMRAPSWARSLALK